MTAPSLCYLCGKPLDSASSVDHVPPKQFYAPEIRRSHSLQLLTIPAHAACNTAYQYDEDYFVHTLVPFAQGTLAGRAVYDEVLKKFKAGKKAGLTKGVLEEFDPNPSGLTLPGGKVVKRFKGIRIRRIAWKIVRGLYFHHHHIVLPETHRIWVTLTPVPESQPPDHFRHFMEFQAVHGGEALGEYQGIFSYRFDVYADEQEPDVHHIHYWALLIWDSILLTIMFHDPGCRCCREESKHTHQEQAI